MKDIAYNEMNTLWKNAALLLLLLVYTTSAAEGLMQGCRQPEDRCLPIRFCPLHFNRAKTNELVVKLHYGNQLRGLICQPEHRIDNSLHVCCPKHNIRCSLEDRAAACTRLEHCPLFSKILARELIPTHNTTLCYVHNNQSYFCCPDLHFALHISRIEGDSDLRPINRSIRASGNMQSTTSAFPSCSQDGKAFLVSKPLCDCEYTFVRGTSKACCKLPETDMLISHPKAAKLADVTCGRQPVLIGPRILVGYETERGEFPWMVLLVYKAGVRAFCGGTLIHPRYVLTAAHCIKKYPGRLLNVRLGEHDLVPHTRPTQIQEISIEKEIAHDRHDIALLKLLHPAELIQGIVEPICLPITKQLLMHLPSTLIISGWGKTEHLRPEYRNLLDQTHPLLKADVRVLLNRAECKQDYEVCAGGPGDSNTCYGDSGGPYQAESSYIGSERYVQYAVISSGPAYCDSPDRPSKGMLVSYFVPWILDTMEME